MVQDACNYDLTKTPDLKLMVSASAKHGQFVYDFVQNFVGAFLVLQKCDSRALQKQLH